MGNIEAVSCEMEELKEICSLTQAFGYDVDVGEIWNPGHFCPKASTMGLSAGDAFDITVMDPDDGKPWDLNDPAKRKKAKAILSERRA